MARKQNKQGSVTVFIVLLFAALLTLLFAVRDAAKQTAVNGAMRELSAVWCESVLGEYDRNLYQNYGIFGFYGTESVTAKKLSFYAGKSLNGKAYLEMDGTKAVLYPYSLADPSVFREQVITCGKLKAAGKLQQLLTGADDTDKPAGTRPERSIVNQAILQALPSAGSSSGLSAKGLADAFSSIHSLGDVLRAGTDLAWENVYLRAAFGNAVTPREETYFANEQEYLVCGEKSDQANRKGAAMRIVAIREALNYAYLLQDPELSAEAMEAAALLTPGPHAVITQQLILAGWALAESNNDYRLLLQGKKVPFMKTRKSWALDLESVLDSTSQSAGQAGAGQPETEGEAEEKKPAFRSVIPVIDPGNTAGETYQDYLSGMLAIMDENVKLLRMEDLIQINMQYRFSKAFRMKDHYAGLRSEIEVNGKTYVCTRSYEKDALVPES